MSQEEMNEILEDGAEDDTVENGVQGQQLQGLHRDVAQRFDYALQENENRENYENRAKLADYGTNWFPICGVGAVCFPEQQLPMKFNEDERELYDRLVESARANGFVVLFPLDIQECAVLPYIATLSKVVQANPQTLSMELMGVHRCKVLAYDVERGEANVQLLPELELLPLLTNFLPKYARNYPDYEKRSLASRITGYPFDSLRDVTQNLIEECSQELKAMIGEEPVQQAKDRGVVHFSYFAAQQIFSNRKTEYSLLRENSANARIAAALKYCKFSIGKCSSCYRPIFRNEHIMRLPDQAMTHVNEHGFLHKITLLSEINRFNYHGVGLPSYEFTWFPGYAWTIIQCSNCEQHLGWEFINSSRDPVRFFGIQREGITFQNEESDDASEENRHDVAEHYDDDTEDENGTEDENDSEDEDDSEDDGRIWFD